MLPQENLTLLVRSVTLKRVALYAVLVGVYAALPVWKEYSSYRDVGDLPAQLHAALSVVLGWLLVFRTNTAYARWWEARTLWGGLVNVSRNLAIKVKVFAQPAGHEVALFRQTIIGFSYALRDHLRDKAALAQIAGYEQSPDSPTHVPNYLIEVLYERLNQFRNDSQLTGDEFRMIDDELRKFLEICGGCERIRNTRLARSYRVFARQCVFLFLLSFPWGIANDFTWWTVPMTIITAYFMLGLETVAEHVEEPFGHDEDDLDLDGLCRTIDRTVGEIFERPATSAAVV